MYFRKFLFAFQTTFSLHNLEQTIFFNQLQNNFFVEKGNPRLPHIKLSPYILIAQ